MSDLLTLTQWLSPAFPLGSFSYSHGLEWFIDADEVTDGSQLQSWLDDTLTFGAGRSDAIILSLTHRGHDPQEMAQLARALCTGKERWEETWAQGQAFGQTLAQMKDQPSVDYPLPVAVGLAARDLDLGPQIVTEMYLHAFVSNLISVGVRFIPIGQTAGQRILSALHPRIVVVAGQAVVARQSDIATAAIRGDLASLMHETQDVRLFKT